LDVSMGRGTHGLPRGSFRLVAEIFLESFYFFVWS